MQRCMHSYANCKSNYENKSLLLAHALENETLMCGTVRFEKKFEERKRYYGKYLKNHEENAFFKQPAKVN